MRILQHLASLRGEECFVVLKKEDVVKIDETARRIVNELGFRAAHPRVLEDLRRRGYRTDGQVARIDGKQVESMLNRYVRGIEVNEETLAFDLIKEMGFDGQYMEQEHTAAHFRQELWFPRIIRRLNPSAWNEEKPDMLEEAKKRVQEIVATHDPHPLDPAQEKELDRVVSRMGER